MRTDDAGQNWSALRAGTTDDLTEVEIVDPVSAEAVVIAGGCTLRRSDDGGKSFRRLPWMDSGSRCTSPIAGVSFPSTSEGYVLTEDGNVHRTEDGGYGWLTTPGIPVASGERNGAEATDIFFVEPELGVATTQEGIYRSTDRGLSWTSELARPGGFEAVTFADPLVGYSVGRAGAVYRTANGGLTWSPTTASLTAGPLTLTAVRCADAMRCLVTTSSSRRVLHTVDGGTTWSPVFLPDDAQALAAAFASPTVVVAAGQSGALAVSNDSGASWSTSGRGLSGSFARLRGAGGYLAFAIGNRGSLARTTDGGRSWSAVTVPTPEALVDVSFAGDLNGFVLDGVGNLFRTEDGGASWEAGPTTDAQAVLAVDRDLVLLVGSRGIRRSINGGRDFTRVMRRAVRRAVLFGIDHAAGWLFAYGPTSLFASDDGGETWRRLGRPDHRPLAMVDFVGSRVGFALGKGGRIWRTRDRGRTWLELRATGSDGGIELAFSSDREGYVITNDLFFAKGDTRPDYLLRTLDGGRSWRPQLVSDSRDASSIVTTGESLDILLAGGNEIFSTTTGGETGVRSSIGLGARRRLLARPGSATVSGRLAPAEGGEQVIVSRTEADPRRRQGAVDWRFKTARVRSDGSFSSTWRIRRTSVFVAQWTGNGVLRGAGSKVLKVRVRGR